MNVEESLNLTIYCIRTFLVLMTTMYIYMKIINEIKIGTKKGIMIIITILLISIIDYHLKNNYGGYYSVGLSLLTVIVLNIVIYKKRIVYTIINTIIALGISYLILGTSIIIISIPVRIFNIQEDYIFLIIMSIIYILIEWRLFKLKKVRNGIIFLQKHLENENMDLLLLNIGLLFLYFVMILPNNKLVKTPAVMTIAFAIIMIITIKKSLDAYYKQTLLIQDLKDTKVKLEEKRKEVEELEKENLEIGKRSHSLAHKQKILENKLNEVICNSEIGAELTLNDEMKKLSKEIYGNKKQPELSKTDISLVDDVLRCMQKECIDKNIDFELQITGNIHYMINHYINEEELQILIADHVKDAIIAIEHSDNINRSILVKIGEIDGNFGLYIYDSGIEFEKEVLDNLGKKPITTHKDSGGTGMGFMNTFDTLKKHNASLIIKEIGPVSETEYTKAIMIKLDDKGEFKIDTYK